MDILSLAQKLKQEHEQWIIHNVLQHKTLIMLFQKPSTRTRISFATAMHQLGWHTIDIDYKQSNFSLTDFSYEIQAAMQLGDMLMFRANNACDVLEAASYNSIPIIDWCSEKYHPCQALGDMLTMIESVWSLENLHHIAWLWIENNVCNSLKILCTKLWIQLSLLCPEQHQSSIDVELDTICDKAWYINRTLNKSVGLQHAQFIHTDTWMDMEFFTNWEVLEAYKDQYNDRIQAFSPYQVSKSLIESYAPNAKVMHCLPAHIGYEITQDAIDHPNSIIFTQTANRLHIQKAILLWLWQHK